MINEIIAQTSQQGVARKNRFVVELFLNPTIEQEINRTTHMGVVRRMMFMCETASLPGRTFSSVEAGVYGPKRRYPYQHTYDTVNITFRCGGEMLERRFFDAWQDKVIDPVTYDVNFLNEYASDMNIFQLDVNDKIVYSLKLYDCYPVTINALDLDQSSTDEYHQLDVEFSYDKWVPFYESDIFRFRSQAEQDSESWFDRALERANIGDKIPNVIRRTF